MKEKNFYHLTKRLHIKTCILLLCVSFSSQSIANVQYLQEDSIKSYYKLYNSNIKVSPSKLSYSEIANQITSASTSNYESIKAIYEWICNNISYDTSFRVKTADECFKVKRGVCQAYCELFYRIAKAAGIKSEIVHGMAKDQHGFIDKSGHAWIFAYLNDDHGILLDPTWGAGYVERNVFIKRKNCWTWFNVNPKWMILSHFPKDDSYQLIENKMDYNEFLSISPVSYIFLDYGVNIHDLYIKARTQGTSLPKLYAEGENHIKLLNIPLNREIKVGEKYKFTIKSNSDRVFALNNGSYYIPKSDWSCEGDSIYSLEYMVKDTISLTLGLKDSTNNFWNLIATYAVTSPTEDDWKKVESEYPLCVPDAKSVKNMYGDRWEKAGVDGHKLLNLIRSEKVTELPMLFELKNNNLQLISVPMSKQLKMGNTYIFCIQPSPETQWSIINNGKSYKEWQISEDGTYSLSITPDSKGPLSLFMLGQDGKLWPFVSYEVQ